MYGELVSQREMDIVERQDGDKFESLNRAPTVSARFIFESSRFINQMITASIYRSSEGFEGNGLKEIEEENDTVPKDYVQ
ncbi:hypothetical protein Trydic_g11027 [Trypoxylus dichotomus]